MSSKEIITLKDYEENDKKLKEALFNYNHIIRKNEGGSINTLFKLRSTLLNWLKDSEQEIEYTRFLTAKKIRYMIKNKESLEIKHKNLESDLINIKNKLPEIENNLGDMYVNYEIDELKDEINSISQSYEVRNNISKMMVNKLKEMESKLPLVIEFNNLKQQETTKKAEKKEIEKILKGSNQTLISLTNYYKNLKLKLNESNNFSSSSRNMYK